MENIKKINFYLSAFETEKKFEEGESNSQLILNDDKINKILNKIFSVYNRPNTFSNINEEEKKVLFTKIKSLYNVYQDEGSVLLGTQEPQDLHWFEKLKDSGNFDFYYWNRYKKYLLVNKHFAPRVIDTLENNTLKNIMSYIGNPQLKSEFSKKGLVMGDVQSGKTMNYIGLMTMAADVGYKCIILLTGTSENLRRQTQERVEEGFIGQDIDTGDEVGVGIGRTNEKSKMPNVATSRSDDFKGNKEKSTICQIDPDGEPLIFVIKKNAEILKKVYRSIKSLNTKQTPYITSPLLMIDDEADNASINTNKKDEDPTRINSEIRKILKLFKRATYIGFTATPFANIFINCDSYDEMFAQDLFPKDFIYLIQSPSNYWGPEKYFNAPNKYLRIVKDYDTHIMEMNHKKDWCGARLMDSTYEAINCFLIINAIRDIRDLDTNTHRSMLLNMSRFKAVQERISKIVEDYLKDVIRIVKQCSKLGSEALENETVSSLKKTFDNQFADILGRNGTLITWNEVFSKLYDSIKDIQVATINSNKFSPKLDYKANEKRGLRVIAVGGIALSRGLTLEGLCVSYLYRNTATYDVLMQMGRWFGYRTGYEDLIRIYLTENTEKYYKEISDAIESLKTDIVKMGLEKKTPQDYGIRVKDNSDQLGITASNKMRNASKKKDRKSFWGSVCETPYLLSSIKDIANNSLATIDFLNNIPPSLRDTNVKNSYFRNVPAKSIISFIERLNLSEYNQNFSKQQILRFLKKQLEKNELTNYDTYVIGGDKRKQFINITPMISIPLVERGFDLTDDHKIIRISGSRARLGAKEDTTAGLPQSIVSKLKAKKPSFTEETFLTKERNPLLIIYFLDLKLDYSNSKYFNEAKLSQPNPTPSRNTIWNNNLKIIDENGNMTDHSATITTKQDRHPNSGNLYFDYPKNKLSKYRFLTPRECFLLMGFDENDYEKIIKNNLASRKGSLFFSRDKMYKLAGNSIVVNVLEQIFDTIVSLDELFFSNKK